MLFPAPASAQNFGRCSSFPGLLRTACDCDVNALRRGGGGKGKSARVQFLEFVRSQQSNIPLSIDLNLGPGSNDVVTEYEQVQNKKANSRKGK
ncbi:hypothetical protein HYFRA_00010259 [Hymenoscyphus fraxineus]|uniref:Uncharacterized protein n=1 Tax=Hymenoscyphus fraxineus TaxID=746836 RepID=A0A9N9KV85_9HELO|nr:hypothetical protein HYFRA_00010259 [Hymenoscyphus fraxineus]